MNGNNRTMLQVDALEDRQALTNNISAFVAGGVLNLVELSSSMQTVEITKVPFDLAGQMIRVTGLKTNSGLITLINGQQSRDFLVTSGNVSINLGGGDDIVRISQKNFNNLTVALGDGNDTFRMYNSKLTGNFALNTGTGNDSAVVLDSKLGNDATDSTVVRMGAGSDHFYLGGTTVPATVSGNASILMSNSDAENEYDSVAMDRITFQRTLSVGTGGGTDIVHLSRVIVGDDLLVDTGAGTDTVTLNSIVAVDDVYVLMGDGDDTLNTNGIHADLVSFDGGAGLNDRLTNQMAIAANQFIKTRFELGTIV